VDPTFLKMTTFETKSKKAFFILINKGGCNMVRSETGYILKSFIKTDILDKNDVKTKMPSKYLWNTAQIVYDPGLKSARLSETLPRPNISVQRQHLKVNEELQT